MIINEILVRGVFLIVDFICNFFVMEIINVFVNEEERDVLLVKVLIIIRVLICIIIKIL